MEQLPKLSAAEMERMTSLHQLDPEFRDRGEETGRRLLKERGLLDVEQA